MNTMNIGIIAAFLLTSAFVTITGARIVFVNTFNGGSGFSTASGYLCCLLGVAIFVYFVWQFVNSDSEGALKPKDRFANGAVELDDAEAVARVRRADRRIGLDGQSPLDKLPQASASGLSSSANNAKTQWQGAESNKQSSSSDGDFLTSMLVAKATDSTVVGYLAGGSVTGAFVGGSMSHKSNPTEPVSPPKSEYVPLEEPVSRYTPASSYESSSSSHESSSSSSFDSGGSSSSSSDW